MLSLFLTDFLSGEMLGDRDSVVERDPTRREYIYQKLNYLIKENNNIL